MPLHISIDHGGHKWRSLALDKLRQMKAFMAQFNLPVLTRWFQPATGTRIWVNSCLGMDKIRIMTAGGIFAITRFSRSGGLPQLVKLYDSAIQEVGSSFALDQTNSGGVEVFIANDGARALGFADLTDFTSATLWRVDASGKVAEPVTLTGISRSAASELSSAFCQHMRIFFSSGSELFEGDYELTTPMYIGPTVLAADDSADTYGAAVIADRADAAVAVHNRRQDDSIPLVTLSTLLRSAVGWSSQEVVQYPYFLAPDGPITVGGNNFFRPLHSGNGGTLCAISGDGSVVFTAVPRPIYSTVSELTSVIGWIFEIYRGNTLVLSHTITLPESLAISQLSITEARVLLSVNKIGTHAVVAITYRESGTDPTPRQYTALIVAGEQNQVLFESGFVVTSGVSLVAGVSDDGDTVMAAPGDGSLRVYRRQIGVWNEVAQLVSDEVLVRFHMNESTGALITTEFTNDLATVVFYEQHLVQDELGVWSFLRRRLGSFPRVFVIDGITHTLAAFTLARYVV